MNYNTYKARNYRARKIEHYMVLHGSAPLCECGCGGHVRFNQNGDPNRFITKHNQKVISDWSAALAKRTEDHIDIEPLREGLLRVKDKRGWTLAQLADGCGISLNHLSKLLYGDQRKIKYENAQSMLRRLAGMAAPISTHQRRMANRAAAAERSLPGAR